MDSRVTLISVGIVIGLALGVWLAHFCSLILAKIKTIVQEPQLHLAEERRAFYESCSCAPGSDVSRKVAGSHPEGKGYPRFEPLPQSAPLTDQERQFLRELVDSKSTDVA